MSKKQQGLESSVPANNVKIIEVFNKLRSEQIIVNADYQRKLVWKRQHKLDFIGTILKNYPFPEIYLAPGEINQDDLILIDEIVDGQQRLTTIKNYIEEKDVFREDIPIKKFSELDIDERNSFLNYEISVRYLKNAKPDQIKEIFQRINRTDYALNKTERLNAQWGASEFVCFCKQIVEKDYDPTGVLYVIDEENRKKFLEFFHGDEEDGDSVFSFGDASRMLALQYIMTLVATLASDTYFPRNEKVSTYIETFNENFPDAEDVETRLSRAIDYIYSLELTRTSRWFNKANLFSLIIEIDKADLSSVVLEVLAAKLIDLDYRATLSEVGIDSPEAALTPDEIKYLDFAREAVNQKAAREFRGKFLQQLFEHCRI